MLLSTTYLLFLSFNVAILAFIFRHQHMLPALLNLEAMMLYMACYIPMAMNHQSMQMSFVVVILLTVSVCSASVGLSLMIISSRMDGSDNSSTNTVITC